MASTTDYSTIERRTNPDLYSIAPPTTFLCLAPTTSSSYPTSPSHTPASTAPSVSARVLEAKKTESVSSESAVVDEPAAEATPVGALVGPKKTRRTSSMTSNGSTARRFLKLGPIHGGENHSDVWSEITE